LTLLGFFLNLLDDEKCGLLANDCAFFRQCCGDTCVDVSDGE
jgi:hypothetical protein